MVGYSGTPLAKKLGIRSGHRVGILSAPMDFAHSLSPLPDDVDIATQARGAFDVIVIFVHRESELRRRFEKTARRIVANGGIWVAWPKKSSEVPTDLAFDVVRNLGLSTGMVDNKVCAIDETYSGLRFVVRIDDRDEWPPA